MADETTSGTTKEPTTWMSDVQRAIALILIGSFATLCIVSTLVVVWTLDRVGLADMAKTLQAALVNMALIALGFFFGNTMAKMAQDKGQQEVVNKLTSPPPNGPVAPVPSPPGPTVVVAWWSLLTDDEKAAMTAAAKTDAKIQALIATFAAGKAEQADLAALVAAGLLTPERAATFKGA